MMRIHVCPRCEGCGYLSGGFRWEIAWSRLSAGTAGTEDGAPAARPCADCGGTGALLELEAVGPASPALPSRRGLPTGNPYVRHVAMLLQAHGR